MRRFLVGLALSAVSVVLLWRLIDWALVKQALETANPWLIALAVACLLLSLGAKTIRWRLLLPSESTVTTPRLFRILHISFLLNNVLPARMGDVARLAMTTRQPGLRLGHVLSSLLTERVADTLTLLACFAAVSPFLPVPEAYRGWLRAAWLVLAVAVLLALMAVLVRRHLGRATAAASRHWRWPAVRVLRDEASSFRDGFRQLGSPRSAVRVWGWSVVAWSGAFAINWSLMWALGIHTPMAVAVLLTCTTNLAMLVPSSPGYIGVFHAAATLSLVPFNVGASQALSFAILAHLVNVLPVSLLGAAFLLFGREHLALDWRRARAREQA